MPVTSPLAGIVAITLLFKDNKMLHKVRWFMPVTSLPAGIVAITLFFKDNLILHKAS